MNIDNFRKNLQVVRASQGITGPELSKLAGLRQMKRISDIERGTGIPELKEVWSICDVLKVAIDDMLNKTVTVNYTWSYPPKPQI